MREQAEAAGVDTSSLKTRALAQLRSVNAEDLPGKVQELNEAGGTNAAATKILHEYKGEKQDDSEIEVPDFDENTIEPSSISESDFYESEKEPKTTTHVSSKPKNCELFIWLNYATANKESFLLGLEQKLKKVAPDTTLCIQDCGRVFEISGLKYDPGLHRLIFLSDNPDAKTLE